jgi:hypothetical protein
LALSRASGLHPQYNRAMKTVVIVWDPVSRSFKRDFYIELALDWENYWEYLL